jgi:O-antigen/teichoic acid export membrane protein
VTRALESPRGYDGRSQTHEERSLGHEALRNFRWSVGGQLINRVGVFITGIVLARLLTKADFGEYAVALVVLTVLITINELGVTSALIRWQGNVATAMRTGASTALMASVIIYGVAFVSAPLVARVLGAPSATNLIRVMALALIIDGAVIVPIAVLTRAFRQDRISLAEVGGTAFYMALASGLAVTGVGAWSIVVARIAASTLTALLLLRFSPIALRFGFDREIARKQIRFGLPIVGSAFVAEAVLNADYMVVGHLLGPVQLGVYLLAFNLSTWPVSAVIAAVGRVALATFSRLAHERGQMVNAYTNALGALVSVTLPVAVVLAVLAPEVIDLLYGERWSAAAAPLRFLLMLAVARVAIQVTFELLIADGRPRVPLFVLLIWLVVLMPALALGAELGGLAGVGASHLVVVAVVAVPLLLRLVTYIGVALPQVARQVARPMLAAAAAAAAMLVLGELVEGTVLRLVLVGAAGAATYLLVLLPGNSIVARCKSLRPEWSEP